MIKYITLHKRVQDWETDTYGEPVTIDKSYSIF